MSTPRPVFALVALALAGCGRPAATDALQAVQAPQAPQPPIQAAPPVNPDARVTTYACENGEVVEAGYPDRETAVVRYKDHSYTLKSVLAGSGVRYVGYGLQWWTKGMDQAWLATLKPGETIASGPGISCAAKPQGAVSPPPPGAPGGLPDDKTPVSEAPFTPGSAQGAADVVQTYYALIEAGKYAEAGRLRSDGRAGPFEPYASHHAQVGAPGRVEGAAGSLYVEVPVVIYGRLKTGDEVHQSGKAVLRRVNDVPGSTPAQRRWRIERIELGP